MTIFGILYRDDSKKLSEAELIDVARQIFERKCGEEANLALLSISSEPVPEIEGMLITRSTLVFPWHTIVEVALRDDLATQIWPT